MSLPKSFKDVIINRFAVANSSSMDTISPTVVVVPDSSVAESSHVPASAKLGVSDCSEPPLFP